MMARRKVASTQLATVDALAAASKKTRLTTQFDAGKRELRDCHGWSPRLKNPNSSRREMDVAANRDLRNEAELYRLGRHNNVQHRLAQVPASGAVVMVADRLRWFLPGAIGTAEAQRLMPVIVLAGGSMMRMRFAWLLTSESSVAVVVGQTGDSRIGQVQQGRG